MRVGRLNLPVRDEQGITLQKHLAKDDLLCGFEVSQYLNMFEADLAGNDAEATSDLFACDLRV